MRRLGIVLLAIMVTLTGLWVGLVLNFPGLAVSRYVEGRVNRSQGFLVVLAPAEMRWNRLYIPRAEIRRRDNPKSQPLFILTDFTIPVTWRLALGMPAYAVLGKGGHAEAFLPWSENGESSLSGEILLEEVILPVVLKPIALKGHVNFSGLFTMDAGARRGNNLPGGVLQGQGKNVVISGVHVGKQLLPDAHLSNIDIRLRTGRQIRMERVTVRGDVQGDVTGNLTPNLRQPRQTRLGLQITASFRNTWLAGLGALRPIAESYLKQGRMTVTLDGTIARPRLKPLR